MFSHADCVPPFAAVPPNSDNGAATTAPFFHFMGSRNNEPCVSLMSLFGQPSVVTSPFLVG